MRETRDSFIIKKLKGNNDAVNREIQLIANSGVQFLDFEFDTAIDFESDDVPAYVRTGQFARISELGNHFARFRPNIGYDRLHIPNTNLEIGMNEKSPYESGLSMIESLNLYNGVFFPIPYFSKNSGRGPVNWARARVINLNDVSKRESGGVYHVTFAFDTRVDDSNVALHCAPNSNDVDNSFSFMAGLEATALLNNNEDGTSYVRDWAKDVYSDIYNLSTNDPRRAQTIRDWTDDETPLFEKHYLNMLAFIEFFVQPNDIKLIHFDRHHSGAASAIDVSLILDIGNSRSCGLLVEDNRLATQNASAFMPNVPLELRDLNAPEHIYTGAFESRVEFQKANFDYNYCSDKSSRLYAFDWPSMVRVGPEAARLASMVNSNDGNTGLNSPKRYLWKIKNDKQASEWKFNNSYYQIPVMREDENGTKYTHYLRNARDDNRSAIQYTVSKLINSNGDALFASTGDQSKLKANYSGKSTMTFMLIEIILQAMMQMNSYGYRNKNASSDCPRRLKAIVLTTPPSMPDLEREIFRSCAYQALGVIWKAYGYDTSKETEFAFVKNRKEMFPEVPEIILKWDETLAGQMVYLYNETQKIYNENCKDFLNHLRRPDAVYSADGKGRFNEICSPSLGSTSIAVSKSVSARIASIDIGGGTTDLVIADYAFPDKKLSDRDDPDSEQDVGNQSASIEIRQILKDGFKIAGDDLLLDLIRKFILPQIGDGSSDLLSRIVGTKSDTDVRKRKNRVQSVEQIFAKIGYRLLSRLESLEKAPRGVIDIKVSGTVLDFIRGSDKCNVPLLDEKDDSLSQVPVSDGAAAVKHVVPKTVNEKNEVKKYISAEVLEYIKSNTGIDIAFVELNFDLYKINHLIASGSDFNLCKSINRLNALVNAYQCDALLLTGRVSKIPGVRTLIERKSHLSGRRIVSLHRYRCGSWYPAFSTAGGRINDPKSTVVVGALLGYTKYTDSTKLVNFRVNSDPLVSAGPCRFLGALNADHLEDNEVLYRYCTTAEKLEAAALREGNEEFNRAKVYTDPKNVVMEQIKKDADDNDYLRKFVKTFPINIGYRQFENSEYPATMLYTLAPYSDVNELARVRASSEIYIPEINDISFDAKGEELLRKSLIDKLFISRKVNYREKAMEAFAKAKNEADLIMSDPYQRIRSGYENDAELYARGEAGKVKTTGISKLFGGEKKAEQAYEEAKARYIEQRTLEIESAVERARSEDLKILKNNLVRDLILINEDSTSELRELEEEKLRSVADSVTRTSHSFEFEICISDINDVLDNPVADSLKFIGEQNPDDFPKVSVLCLKSVNDKSPGGESGLEEYLELRLRTVTPDAQEYWNNTGILLKV